MEKKVVMFTEIFANGGIEKIMYDLNKNISQQYKICNLCINNTSSIFNDIEVNSLINKKLNKAIKRNFLSIRKYQKFLKENKFDILHIHTHWAFGYIGAFLGRKYVTKIIIHAHNSMFERDPLKIKSFINSLIKKIFYNKNYECIACSKESGEFCFKKDKFEIVYNGIDSQVFKFDNDKRNRLRNELNIGSNDIVIGHVGRFEKQKNHEFLLKVFEEAYKQNENLYLIMIGKGSKLDGIKENIDASKLNDRVKIIEETSNIVDFYNAFDYFCLPSLFEGFPISLLEAEYNGLYCFISDNIDKLSIISNKTFSLPLDIETWKDKLLEKRKLDRENTIINNIFEIKSMVKSIESKYTN